METPTGAAGSQTGRRGSQALRTPAGHFHVPPAGRAAEVSGCRIDCAAAETGRARMKDSLSRVGALDSIRQMDANPSTPANPEHSAPVARSVFQMDLKAWIRDILLSLALATVVIVFLCQPVKVEGTSMLPELADKQRVFVNKLLYRIDSIERGDVIVFKLPEDPSRSYIKRVVGLPGETVEIRKGSVYIDGQPLPESYVPARYPAAGRQSPQ